MTDDDKPDGHPTQPDKTVGPVERDNDGITIGQWRLRYIIVGVVTAVWVVDVGAVIIGQSAGAQQSVLIVFMVVVGWTLGVEIGLTDLFRNGRKDD